MNIAWTQEGNLHLGIKHIRERMLCKYNYFLSSYVFFLWLDELCEWIVSNLYAFHVLNVIRKNGIIDFKPNPDFFRILNNIISSFKNFDICNLLSYVFYYYTLNTDSFLFILYLNSLFLYHHISCSYICLVLPLSFSPVGKISW